MKTSKIIAAAALAVLAAMGAAHAEEYQGVQAALTSQRTRAEVQAEAVAAVRDGKIYSDAADAGVTQVTANGSVDRATVRAQAVAASHDPTANLDRKAFFNSTIPPQYKNGSLAVRRQQQSRTTS